MIRRESNVCIDSEGFQDEDRGDRNAGDRAGRRRGGPAGLPERCAVRRRGGHERGPSGLPARLRLGGSAEPNQTQSVTVPTKDSEVFSRYNELQKSQGYDLTPYRGKTLTRYVYEVLNYPNADQPVYATLLVSEGTVVGGDITNTAPDGTMHGFRQPTA